MLPDATPPAKVTFSGSTIGLAVVDLHPGLERLDGEIGRRDHLARIQGHVHVHDAQPLDMERDIGEEIAAGFELQLRLLLLGRDIAALARRRADERRQIGEVQMLRYQIGLEEGSLGPLVDGDRAEEVAFADMPFHIVEPPDALLAMQLAQHAVGRCRGPRNAEQGKDIGQILTRQGKVDIRALELEGILDGAFQCQLGRAEDDVELEGIGRLVVAQRQDRAADEMQGEGLVFQAALQLQLGLIASRRLADRSRYGAVELEPPLAVVIDDMSVLDLQLSDDGSIRAFLGRDLFRDRRGSGALLEAPVQLALVISFQGKLGGFQGQSRQHDMAAEQRPEADVEIDQLGGQHMRGLAPIGIGDLDAVEAHPRGPAPVELDLGDRGLAPCHGAGAILDLGAQIVGGDEEIEGAYREPDQQHKAAERPGEDFEGSFHGRWRSFAGPEIPPLVERNAGRNVPPQAASQGYRRHVLTPMAVVADLAPLGRNDHRLWEQACPRSAEILDEWTTP